MTSNVSRASSLIDLPDDLLQNVFSRLDQGNKVNIGRVCRRFHALVTPLLYANLFITSSKFSARDFRDARDYACESELSKWSIVSFSFSDADCQFKQLELSLSHPSKAALVDKLITDDISFVLFKIRFWQKRFFQTKGPRTVYFGNVATNHFSIGYDDVFRYYMAIGNGACNLTNLQMRNVPELQQLLRGIDVSQFHNLRLNFHITDIGGITLANLEKRDPAQLLQFLTHVSELRVFSVHNLGLQFLRNLNHVFGDSLFPSLRTLSLNHIHGQTTGTDRFNFNSLYDLSMEMELSLQDILRTVNVDRLEKLDLSVGCNHIYCSRDSMLPRLADLEENEYCGCLTRFFKELASNMFRFPSLKSISISKMGHSVVANPYSMYHFKKVLIQFLQRIPRLHKITIDTNAALYPYHNMVADKRFREMVEIFNTQNSELYGVLRNSCEILDYVDYFESAHIWRMATAKTDSCLCNSCQDTKERMFEFVGLNRQIQFYLNPTIVKSTSEYLYDLIATVCDIMRRSYHYRTGDAMTSNMGPAGVSATAKAAAARQISSPEPGLFAIMGLLADQIKSPQISLHDLFSHNNYKQLICPAHNIAERARCWAPELTCRCDGTELRKFAQYIQHQATEGCKAISS
ncbi:hypothetical protein JA9_001975 [Meyerozyma sp. JA9]|nr:hypothetical protein JA9_001975 [Meyerozyma sp. JA9]